MRLLLQSMNAQRNRMQWDAYFVDERIEVIALTELPLICLLYVSAPVLLLSSVQCVRDGTKVDGCHPL